MIEDNIIFLENVSFFDAIDQLFATYTPLHLYLNISTRACKYQFGLTNGKKEHKKIHTNA